ncbi:MAG: hypothetical protein IJZ51_01785 [Ruminiclostridium sp.]|nr:hypothetical protein [Ruminiclostridium sp.]
MKLRKIMAGIAAAAVASSTLAVAASATLVVPESTDPACIPGTGMWLVQIFNVGNAEENKPATDRGIDLTKVDGVRFTVAVDLDNEELGGMGAEFFEGAIGGGIVMSINGGDIVQYDDPADTSVESEIWTTYNWATQAWWGCKFTNALGEEVDTNPNTNNEDTEDDNPVSAVAVGDFKYELTATGFANPFTNTEDAWEIDEIGCMQVALQEWGTDLVPLEVLSCEILDADGNVLLAFDGVGNETAKVPAGDTPATDAPATDAPATDAPATDAPATDAPTTGDSSKPNAGTGVEGVALVAGIAVLATGAIVVAKKRS